MKSKFKCDSYLKDWCEDSHKKITDLGLEDDIAVECVNISIERCYYGSKREGISFLISSSKNGLTQKERSLILNILL